MIKMRNWEREMTTDEKKRACKIIEKGKNRNLTTNCIIQSLETDAKNKV